MTSVLRDLEAQYAARAAQAQIVAVVAPEPAVKRKATRTYTGAALERRRAWGRRFGAVNSEFAKQLRAYGGG